MLHHMRMRIDQLSGRNEVFMTLKEQVLSCLEKNRTQSISGEQLAEKFNVSRSAVWKVINALRTEGYDIEAVSYTHLSENNRIWSRNIFFCFAGIYRFFSGSSEK